MAIAKWLLFSYPWGTISFYPGGEKRLVLWGAEGIPPPPEERSVWVTVQDNPDEFPLKMAIFFSAAGAIGASLHVLYHNPKTQISGGGRKCPPPTQQPVPLQPPG